jgi:hypothetical protein
VDANEASAGWVEQQREARRRVIAGYERRAELHEQRALEHGTEGRAELARRELELARWQRNEALVRRAALDDSDRTWTTDTTDDRRARRWYVELPVANSDGWELKCRVARQLTMWHLGAAVSEAAIAAAALAAAAERRGRARVLGLVTRPGVLTVEVHNDGAVLAPARSRLDVVGKATSAVLDAIASDWGWRPTATGIALWCQLSTSA